MKRMLAVISLLLCLCLLGGCGFSEAVVNVLAEVILSEADTPADTAVDTAAPEDTPAPEDASAAPETDTDAEETLVRNPENIRFEDLEYVRCDLTEMEKHIETAVDAMQAGESYSGICDKLEVCLDDLDHFSTLYAVANIRNSQNLQDEYYAGEYSWISEQSAEVDRMFEGLYFACAASEHGEKLEEEYFWPGFCQDYEDPSKAHYTEKTVPLMQQEAALIVKYRAQTADPTVLWEGEEVSYNDLADSLPPYRQLEALLLYYDTYREPMAELLRELVLVRRELAEAMGYDSYEAMQYDFYYMRDYTPAQAGDYLADIRDHLVPLYCDLRSRGMGGGIGGSINEKTLFLTMKNLTEKLGGNWQEAYAFMEESGMCDLSYDSRKANLSFEMYLPEIDCPYLFVNPSGELGDVLTVVHEFGHFTDDYVNYGASETIDLAECFSQGLELLALNYLDGIVTQTQLDELYEEEMYSTLNCYIQQASFAEFENILYSLPEEDLTAEAFCEIFAEVAGEYGYLEPGYERLYQYIWMDIPHFYEAPLYVISYPVALDVAFQFYQAETENSGEGLALYIDTMENRGEKLLETVEQCHLESPFAPGRVKSVYEVFCDFYQLDNVADAA